MPVSTPHLSPPLFQCVCVCLSVVVEEENELEGVAVSSISFDKLSEQERHLVRHRELFLSRQIETYKIDMVRCVGYDSLTCIQSLVVCVCVCAVASAQ